MTEAASDILRRIDKIEDRIDDMETKLEKQSKTDLVMNAEMRALRKDIGGLKEDFTGLKSDVLITVQSHADKTWDLINKSWKIVMALIAIIVIFAGIKLSPEILKFFFA